MAQDDCLTFFTAATDWYAAEETCAERGGHLASINTGSANLFIRQQAREHQWSAEYWTGGSNAGGDWVWSDGAPFEYRRSVCHGRCALHRRKFEHGPVSCYDAKPFVCKFAPVTSEETPKPTPPHGPPAGGPKPGPKPTFPLGPKVTCDEEWTYSDVTGKCYKVVKNPQGTAWGQQVCDTESAKVLSIHNTLENDVALSR
ncbi:CLEC-50 protein [Aphelenchoides avenae]|nr:CLEC-50 protein [Aphelenchus avenae]